MLSLLSFVRFVKKLEHSWKALVHDGVSGKIAFFSVFSSNSSVFLNCARCPRPSWAWDLRFLRPVCVCSLIYKYYFLGALRNICFVNADHLLVH